jgi:hypothetical protein
MFNVCPKCGQYCVEKEIRPGEGWRAEAICPGCGYGHPFLRPPLFVITGASGSGKSTLCLALAARDQTCLHIDTDILWGALPASPDDDYVGYHNAWLRVAKNAAQGGRAVALYSSANPGQLAACVEGRYFSAVYFLALVCDSAALTDRLKARPAWRGTGQMEFITAMLAYNRWFQEHAGTTQPPMTLLDTTRQSLHETIEAVSSWLRQPVS